MMRNCCLFFAGLLLLGSASAQVSINTNLTTGTMTGTVANLYQTAYLHFQLVNCGDNVPVLPGQPNVMVQDSFDLTPATPGSAIVGEIIGNDQITCGNVISTYYVVTAMKDPSHPLRDGIPYVICSANATISTCGNSASLGTFNLVTADPQSQPPPVPGFTEIYGNPTNSQTINQPINGIAGWTQPSTSFTFTNGLTLGPVPTSELSLLTGFTTMIITTDSTPGSVPCTGGGTGALAVYLNGIWNCAVGAGSATAYYQTVEEGGTAQTQQPILNFIPGTNVTISCANNSGAARTDCTFSSSAGGTVNSGTLNELAIYTSATAVSSDANLMDANNLFSILDTNGASLPSDGVHAGAQSWIGGTPPTVGSSPGQLPVTGYFGWIGPSANSSPSVYLQPPTGAPTGGPLNCNAPSGNISQCNWGGSGGGNPTLDNCTPDQLGNSFYQPVSLTEYFYATWQFVFNTATYINCTVYIPTAATGATIVLDIAANDSTAGHTAYFQTCDGVINSGTINISTLTCAAEQTFTTTSTAYNRVTLTFNVQSTLSNGSILVVKIATITTGTAPTANMLVYPHFVL